jgi:CRISPR-associated endonuclease/helicase Cas3
LNEHFKILRAKTFKPITDSKKTKAPTTYIGHIANVLIASEVLVNQLGEQILYRMGLTQFSVDDFSNTVKLGAYLHDWGKANSHFQEMLYLKSIDKELKENGKDLSYEQREKLKKSKKLDFKNISELPS